MELKNDLIFKWEPVGSSSLPSILHIPMIVKHDDVSLLNFLFEISTNSDQLIYGGQIPFMLGLPTWNQMFFICLYIDLFTSNAAMLVN